MIRLEALAHAHVDALFAALDHPAIATYIGGPETRAALAARVDKPAPAGERWLNFAVLADERVVGRVEATIYSGYAEIAYLIGPADQQRGIGSQAVALLLAHLPAEVWAAIHPANAASIALVTKLGFVAAPPTRPLGSYDPGDATFVLDRSSYAR